MNSHWNLRWSLCQVSNSLSCWACNSGEAIYMYIFTPLILLHIMKSEWKTLDLIKNLRLERIIACVYALLTLLNNNERFPAGNSQMTRSHTTSLTLSPQDAHSTRNCNVYASTHKLTWTSLHLLLEIIPNCTRWFLGFPAHFSYVCSSVSFKNQ